MLLSSFTSVGFIKQFQFVDPHDAESEVLRVFFHHDATTELVLHLGFRQTSKFVLFIDPSSVEERNSWRRSSDGMLLTCHRCAQLGT